MCIRDSRCADGAHKTFARWWMHNGMLTIAKPASPEDGDEVKRAEKMSKSVGNVLRVHELVRKQSPEALRYALLSAHYRQPLEWSDALVEQSIRTLDRLYGTLRDLADVDATPVIPDSIEAALDDDLNTPQALSLIHT